MPFTLKFLSFNPILFCFFVFESILWHCSGSIEHQMLAHRIILEILEILENEFNSL